MGTNFWQAMNLAAKDPEQLKRELDTLESLGITNLRILALSEGPGSEPYRIVPAIQNRPGELDEELLKALDFVLVEMKKRHMTAVICLSNFWPWSGGFAQWVSWSEGSSIPYPPPHPGGSWGTFQEYSSRFYTLPEMIKMQQESVRKIITRKNTISHISYKNDPTIMSWQLANEPRGGKYRSEFLKWISSSAKFIRSLDKNHLITVGSEGETLNAESAGNHFKEDHSIPEIDYTTIHIWVENWGIYDPKNAIGTMSTAQETLRNYIASHVAQAKELNKPIVLEEFGMARDQRSMDPDSSTKDRDMYYEAAFQEVLKQMQETKQMAGVNFWAWSGEARPHKPYGSLWKLGDNILGDPPHEEQGWYGVYKTDLSTHAIIQNYAKKIHQLKKK